MNVEQEEVMPVLPQRRQTGVGIMDRAAGFLVSYQWLPMSMVLLFGLWWLLRPSRVLALFATPQSAVAAASMLAIGAFVLFLPASAVLRLSRPIQSWLRTDRRAITLLLLLAAALRFLYGDHLGWSLDQTGLLEAAQGFATAGFRPFFAHYTDYSWLGHQHPPLVALYFGMAIRLFGISPFTIAVAAFVITAGVVVSTFLVGKLLYSRWVGFTAALLLLCIRALMEHNVNMSNDMPLVLCFLLAIWGMVRMLRHPSHWNLLGTGIAIGAGLLAKYTMLLFYGWLAVVALGAQWLWPPVASTHRQQQSSVQLVRRSVVGQAILAGGIGLLLFAPWVLFSLQSGALGTHVESVAHYSGIEQSPDGSARVTLANEWHNDQRLRALVERWPASFGFYNLPLLGLGLLTMFRNRRWADWLVLLWAGAVIVPVFLLLPVWRYIMPALPALALVMARGLRYLPKATRWRTSAIALLCTTSLIYLNLYT